MQLNNHRLEKLLEAAREAEADVIGAVETANAQIESAVEQANEAVAAYNDALARLTTFRDECVEELETFIEKHTDDWAAGADGRAHRALLDAWRGLDLEPSRGFSAPELEFEPGDVTVFEQAPTSPDEV